METNNQRARRFGQILEQGFRQLDAGDAELLGLRDAVIQMTVDGASPRRKRYLIASGLIAASAALALLLIVPGLQTESFVFFVGDSAEQAEVGEWVRTGMEEKSAVRFTNGSRFDVGENTEARIVEADAERVTVDLNDGTLRLHVVPGEKNRWTVRAGPYSVRVVGTRFGVEWDAATSELAVEVTKGRVSVRGPGIDAQGINVTAGQLLRAERKTGLVAYGPASQLREVDDSPYSADNELATQPGLAKDSKETDRPAANVRNEAQRMPPKSWQSLAKKKQYKAALLAARRAGLDKLSLTLSSEGLWSLATAARYAGEPDDAAMLFEAQRDRFPSSPRSKTAAYLLAVLALDQQRNPRAAKRWLETYLKEAPDGTLHEEALGRLMHLTAQMGLSAAARRHAGSYLEKYPDGHFSGQARSILNR
jgi:TolA-binding protein